MKYNLMLSVVAATIASASFTSAMAANDKTATASAAVTVNPTTQRFFGDESTFDRGKFVRFHDTKFTEDVDYDRFKKDYNVPDDYIGGRRFYYPIAHCKGGKVPETTKKKYEGVREVYDYVATGSSGDLFYDKTLNYAQFDLMPHIKSVAEYVAASLRDEWEYVPKYLEPFNEPMVHAAEFCKSVNWPEKRDAIAAVQTYVCKFHNELAKAVKSTPELKEVKMLGYACAYPEFEVNNFGLWDVRFKQFIDIAGENIDILSFHLYDGSGVNNQGGRRSGSNIEAIMDMLQTYTYIKFGAPKPMAITEYGRLVPNQPAWEQQSGAKGNTPAEGGPRETVTVSNYHPVTNSQAVRSQLHMVTAFMNRQNEIEYTIPFTIGKAPLTAMYCKSSLWVKQFDGSYEYSNRRFFFEMLKDLEGDNVEVSSSNIDIQTLALADGKRLHLMLNNLYDTPCKVDLSVAPATSDILGVSIKTLKIFENKAPECEVKEYKAAPKSITLEYGETAVVTYYYKKNLKYKNTVVRNKYYSNNFLQEITKDGVNVFSFDSVPIIKDGSAILRLGVNRKLTLQKEPTVLKINGTQVEIKGDVIKGYNQEMRKQFFGTLEIPVDIAILKDGLNIVEIKYGESGGFVTTAILQIDAK